MFKKFLPIILLTFVNIIGFTLLIPILPEVIKTYIDESYSGLLFGVLISSYALSQFFAAPIMGSLSDKYGRKPLLFISQLGTTLSWVIFGIAYFIPAETNLMGISLPLAIIAFSRVIDGLTGGNISVANAWASDMTDEHDKTKAFGILGATFGVGFLIGPVIGGLTYSLGYGYLTTVIVAFLISLITLLLVYFGLPESLKEENRDRELKLKFWKEINILHKISEFRDNRFISNLLLIRVFFALVFSSYTTIIILILEQDYNLKASSLGIILSLIGLFSIFNQAFIAPKLSKKFGDLKVLYLSLALLFFGLVTVPLIPKEAVDGNLLNLNLLVLLANAFVLNLAISLGMPTFKSLLVKNVKPNRQGTITGVDESLLSFGNGVTPVMAGTLYSLIGGYAFLIYALFLLAPNLIIWIKEKRLFLDEGRNN
jgi:MFS transporter, DHA1 family, tetracycline resistance protein